MINHYYTLKCGLISIQKIIGYKLIDCFTQEKGLVVFHFCDSYSEYVLNISLLANNYCYFVKPEFAKSKSNYASLFPEIIGETLQDCSIEVNNRIITLSFIHSRIEIELFGGAKNNIFVISSKNKIINAFNNKKDFYLTQYERKFSNVKPIAELSGNTLYKVLTRSEILLPTFIAEELLKKFNLTKQNIFDYNNQLSNYADILIEAENLKEQCLNANQFFIYEDGNGGLLLSLVKLNSFTNPKIYVDIDSAIIKRYSTVKRVEDFDTVYNDFYKKLDRIRKRIISSINVFNKTLLLSSKISEYKTWAEYLLSQANPKIKPGNSIQIISWEGETMLIPLDEKLNLIDNADKYYKKAKKIKDSIEQKKILLPKYQKRLSEINSIFDKLKTIQYVKELLKFKKEVIAEKSRTMNELDDSKASKFREFDLGEGYTLFVGRNSSNNDELTCKFAKANDIWLHARGSAGSHAVLRHPMNKEHKPPKYILQTAASITAYYSKQKNAKYVNVAYTFKKYVNKPKGAAAGAVVMTKEQVIMAEPKLPAGNED
jgi:predicted ribosome quality control (RQC) complex YloA/Tae2 family protein